MMRFVEEKFWETAGDPTNNRPIVAVLSQELSRSLRRAYGHLNYTSYIGAAYIKYVEMAGARAVPVLINQPDEYYQTIFRGTNGLLIPGGSTSIRDSGYQRAAQKLFEMSMKAFDESGDYYPVWGTCLGFEALAHYSNKNQEVLTRCWSQDQALNLNFTSNYSDTHIMQQMPEKIHKILAESNVTANFHRWCVSPQTYQSNELLKNFWNVIATNHDDNGTEFISLFESKNYPIWGSQFHPEKNNFEWSTKRHNIPHFQEAIDASTYFANFFVNECRKNQHHFASRQEEQEYLIYNYSPTYSGNIEVDYVMEQCYFFENHEEESTV